MMYNSFLKHLLKCDRKIRRDPRFKQACSLNKDDEEENQERKKLFNELTSEYSYPNDQIFHRFATPMIQHFSDNIDSGVGQKLATRAFNAYKKYKYGEAKKLNFKKYKMMDSIEGKSNNSELTKINKHTSLTFTKDRMIHWKGLSIPVIVKKNDEYAEMALLNKIKYVRLKRELVRGKIVWYTQLVIEGYPPSKVDKNTGLFKRRIGEGSVGIDIGTQTVGYVSDNDCKLYELAPNIDKNEKEMRRLQRKLDRSRRATNPNKYNENGTIKRGNRDRWIRSKNYIKTRNKYIELHRLIKVKRKQSHEMMANEVISQGNIIKVEDMDFRALQKRMKKTEVSEKTGKIKRKKRFGKSIGNKAPSMLISIIDRKLKYHGSKIIKIDTKMVKASQYNHEFQTYKKKKLSERWNEINGEKIQRDLYSAFLIKNVKDDNKTIDNELCKRDYEKFRIMHHREIERLRNLKSKSKLISSMGL